VSSTNRLTPEAACGSLGVTRASRRRLLALFAAVLAALGLRPLTAPELAEAKKGKHKNKKKNRRKKKKGRCQQRDTSYSPESEEQALVNLINGFRAQNGKGSLAIHERLGAAARHHSQDMANKNYVRHKLSNGASPADNIRCHGYSYRAYGENIAAGYERARDTFEQWENSSGHRKMMLGNFNEIGIGRAHNQNARYDWYWTANFGSR
jgi:uncharacterized protein YkwD